MQNYIIRELRVAGLWRANDKSFKLNTILDHLSLESNDYRYMIDIIKQYLGIHRTDVIEFICFRILGECMYICQRLWSGRKSNKSDAKTIPVVQETVLERYFRSITKEHSLFSSIAQVICILDMATFLQFTSTYALRRIASVRAQCSQTA